MKEYDEDEAVAAMTAALADSAPAEDDVWQVLDLIFDYYDENGQLDIDADADDDEDIDDMAAYVAKFMKGKLTDGQIKALIAAEIDYENSLL